MSPRPDRTPRPSPLAHRHPARPAAPPSATAPAQPEVPSAAKPPSAGSSGTPNKVKTTYNLTPEVAQAARDAFWLDRDEFQSLSDFVEDAIRRQVEATKAKHGLDQLPRRTRPLPTGRPLRY